MSRKLVILGAGDLGREVMHAASDHQTVAFVDDDAERVGTTLERVPVIDWTEIARLGQVEFIAGSGEPSSRRAMVDTLLSCVPQPTFASVVHPSVVIMPNVEIEPGSFVAPNVTLATGVRIGQHVVVNQNVSLGHDCILGRFSVVSPGCALSGRTTVGEATFLGSSAVTYPGVRVGAGCVVSALTAVTKSLRDGKKLIAKPQAMIL